MSGEDTNEIAGDIPLHRLLDALPMCISYLDTTQVYRYTNKTYEIWFKRPRAEVNGRHMTEVLGQEAFNQIRSRVEAVLSGREIHFETRIPYKDAGLRDVEASYVPDIDDSGTVQGFFALVRDISERKRAEKALHQQGLLLNNVHDSVSSTNAHGIVQTWNSMAEHLYGYRAEEAIGQHVSLIFVPEERDWLPNRIFEMVKERGTYHSTGRRLTADGRVLTVDAHMTLLTNDAGEPDGILTMCNDITEQLSLREQLLTAVEDEQQRLGHDLHDLLGSHLTGLAIMAGMWAQEVEAGQRTVTADALQHLATMIKDGVKQAQGIARGLAEGRVEEYGLREALIRYLRDAESFSQVRCKLVFPVALASIGRDPEVAHHLYYIVREAVNNVVKHSRATRVDVRFRRIHQHVELSISDDGIGPKNAMGKFSGKGMGVHTMRHRAALIGGTLEIAHGEGKGTVVRCTFPMPMASLQTGISRSIGRINS